jgi:hypothetical protein
MARKLMYAKDFDLPGCFERLRLYHGGIGPASIAVVTHFKSKSHGQKHS